MEISLNSVTIAHAISVLNDALRNDSQAINNICGILIPCSYSMAQSEVECIQVDKHHFTNLLGIINAIFAYSNLQCYYRIFPVYEGNTLVEFRLGKIENEEGT